ncbi:hypothetical protein LUZ60_006890 [Juncus effusus]|nr:hypothetical protein LUZ60_006890 [Juncus effusus]
MAVSSANFDELERDLDALLRDQNNHQLKSSPFEFDPDDLNMYRSGSAPPTVEGSRTAFGGLFEGTNNGNSNNNNQSSVLDEEDEDYMMRSHPAYLSYYYSNENVNPRLPPPIVSREDWRAAQRFHAGGGGSVEVGGGAAAGLGGGQRFGGVGDRRRKVGFEESSLFAQQPSMGSDIGLLGSRRKSFVDALQDNMTLQTPQYPSSRPSSRNDFLLTGSELLSDPQPGSTSPTLARVRSLGHSAGLAGGPGPGRTVTPDPQLVRRTPSPCLPPVGVRMNERSGNEGNLGSDLSDAILAMGNMKVGYNGGGGGNSAAGLKRGTNDYAAQMLNSQRVTGGLETDFLNIGRSQVGGASYHAPAIDPVYGNYPQTPTDPLLNSTNYLNNSLSQIDPLSDYQKAYLSALLAQQQKLQYVSSNTTLTNTALNNTALNLNRGLYGRDVSFNTGYVSPVQGSLYGSLTAQARARTNERLTRGASMRSAYGGSDTAGFLDEGFAALTLLEDFKTNKTKNFELADIVGHVVEFSSDQYGSRFIQQKLETASLDEKNKIFPEIFPHARALMTDVFGNYVIQKFFEHGTDIQRRQLATQLKGHVLQLTLQMYGCRVIQKALEVVDVDQQTDMVSELEGSIMRCVRDQNGNHVVQKCIECVPQDKIQFIISSFYGHVVELSTHPYGCRVIQRVLEHCDDELTQSIMMDEIMPCVMTLAQDQYGNYVIQHVLQHGKAEERSVIIKKLAGQIVQMSLQKFASNVVEKCLTFGTPDERQILIDEMLGSTDENEPLQVMMKDQFANYVVQKVLETCDEANRELILSRIKVHLNALKKYTYGKHIVARVEKLIAAGERVSAMS